jgi:hypothetical protein
MRSFTLAILFLENDRSNHYAICALAEIWKADGNAVHFLHGTKEYVPADLLFLHINLTVIPDSILEFARRYPKVINLQATDIRKRLFSSLLVTPDSSYSGEVILKTDLNHGGGPEAKYHPDRLYRLACRWQTFRLKVLSPIRDWRKSIYYPVYPSIQNVPKSFWKSPRWVIEKFVPERLDNHFVIRNYRFLGSRESALMLVSKTAFIREHELVKVCSIDLEPELQKFRRKFKLDYGKIDYVLVDGKPVVLDINKTMGYNAKASFNPEVLRTRKELAQGIYDYLVD